MYWSQLPQMSWSVHKCYWRKLPQYQQCCNSTVLYHMYVKSEYIYVGIVVIQFLMISPIVWKYIGATPIIQVNNNILLGCKLNGEYVINRFMKEQHCFDWLENIWVSKSDQEQQCYAMLHISYYKEWLSHCHCSCWMLSLIWYSMIICLWDNAWNFHCYCQCTVERLHTLVASWTYCRVNKFKQKVYLSVSVLMVIMCLYIGNLLIITVKLQRMMLSYVS